MIEWKEITPFWIGFDSEGRLIGRVWKRVTETDRRWAAMYCSREELGCSQDGFTKRKWAKQWIEELEEMSKERLITVRKNYVSQDYFLERDGLI